MPSAPKPEDEHERHAALLALNILDKRGLLDFEAFPQLAARAFDAPSSAISLVDTNRQWFMASVGLTDTQTPRSSSFCAHAILSPGNVLYVPDARRDTRFIDNPLTIGDRGVRAYAGAPILGPTGHPLGALCVMDTQPRRFNAAALATLVSLAGKIETALRLHGGLEELRNQARDRTLLQTRLAALFDDADEPVVVVRSSGAILLGNAAYRAVSGYTQAALAGSSLQDLFAPEYRAAAGAAHARQLGDGEPLALDSAILHRDGTRIPVHVTATLLRRADAPTLRVITLQPRSQALPINIPQASTSAPPTTICSAALKRLVSM